MNDSLIEYMEKYSSKEPLLLRKLRDETYSKVAMPQMMCSAYQGRLLSIVSKMISPKSILEIGTFTGYATLCLAEGLQKGGKIYTIEKNISLVEMIVRYFKDSNFDDCISVHIGDALEIIPTIDTWFDVVFIDADKKNYSNYYKAVFEKVKSGGYIITDNVLWHGKVFNSNYDTLDRRTRGIVDFNNTVINDDRVETILLPIRDGIMLTRKL